MNPPANFPTQDRGLQQLKWLLIATFASSILHYVDNILFFDDYPEPVWINPHIVDLFWFVMTPLAPLGYQMFKARRYLLGLGLIVGYGLANMLTLGHYKYQPFLDISFKIHLFILIEAALAFLLIGYVIAFYIKSNKLHN